MKKAFLEYTINYNRADEPYIDYLTSCLNSNIEDIKKFFDIKKLLFPITINLWDDRQKYLEDISNNENHHQNYEINILSSDLKSMYTTMLNQFVNICFFQVYGKEKILKWLEEGISLLLSNSCVDNSRFIDCSLEDIINGTAINSNNYYTLISYVLSQYGQEYLIILMQNYDFALDETPNLYKEAKDFYYDKARKRINC